MSGYEPILNIGMSLLQNQYYNFYSQNRNCLNFMYYCRGSDEGE